MAVTQKDVAGGRNEPSEGTDEHLTGQVGVQGWVSMFVSVRKGLQLVSVEMSLQV